LTLNDQVFFDAHDLRKTAHAGREAQGVTGICSVGAGGNAFAGSRGHKTVPPSPKEMSRSSSPSFGWRPPSARSRARRCACHAARRRSMEPPCHCPIWGAKKGRSTLVRGRNSHTHYTHTPAGEGTKLSQLICYPRHPSALSLSTARAHGAVDNIFGVYRACLCGSNSMPSDCQILQDRQRAAGEGLGNSRSTLAAMRP